jgi:hypothetical protein
MDRQPILYVVEDRADINSLISSQNLRRVGTGYHCDYHDRRVIIGEADKLRETICGYQFWAVYFHEGLFSAQQINYALCRVRPRRDAK